MAWRAWLPGARPDREAEAARAWALGARSGAAPSVPVRSQPVGPQPTPQRGAADPEAARRLGQLPVGALESVENRLALALRQRADVVAVREEHRLAELQRSLFQRPTAAAERDRSEEHTSELQSLRTISY